ncbi:MAG: flagellar basal-body MS-ring/collar protein FliF [Ilumatobacter sp.]
MATSTTNSNKANELLARVTPLQKVAVGAAVLTLVGGVVLLGGRGNETVMAAAYTDLEPADAAEVTDELVARGIDYELVDGGRTVLVPRDELYEVRVDLSAEGLPASNEGYALLDEQGLTTSEFRQRIDYQRALEGELSRTLRAIDGVAGATVHLALPEDSIFIDEAQEATASVLVTRDGSDMLGNDQVAAMVHLVSSSVKDLGPENVTIADASGRVLTDGTATPGSGASIDGETDFERELANNVRAMVGRVTGLDNVAVNVRADLELTERLQTSERFETGDEETGVVVAERTSEEQFEGTGTVGEAGVLGPDGAPLAAGGGDGESTYSQNDAERTYAVNRTVEQITQTPGAVKGLSVAVLVDESAVTPEQVVALQELVSTAAGIDVDRGDTVTVTALPFEIQEPLEPIDDLLAAEAAMVASQQQNNLIRTGIIAFVVLVALILAYRSTRKARREVSTPIDIGAIRSAGVETPALPTAEDETDEDDEPFELDMKSNEALVELSALADQHPEDVARILQSWLADDGSRL